MTRPPIRARAPLRVSFAGGGTDIPPFPELEGGCVLCATIDRYAYGSLVPRDDRVVTIESVDFKSTVQMTLDNEILCDGSLDLIKAAVRRFGCEGTEGYDLVLRSNAPPGSGLGSSSTMMVALTGLLAKHYQITLDEYQTAQLAHAIERQDLGIAGGLQDLYAATFGGFNFIEFTDRVIVNPLRIRDEIALRARTQPAALLHRHHTGLCAGDRGPDPAGRSVHGRDTRRTTSPEGPGPGHESGAPDR